jgi:hypothetical protein
MQIYTGIINYRHGINFYTANDTEDLFSQFEEYINEWWENKVPKDVNKPKDIYELIEVYSLHTGEEFNWGETELTTDF